MKDALEGKILDFSPPPLIALVRVGVDPLQHIKLPPCKGSFRVAGGNFLKIEIRR